MAEQATTESGREVRSPILLGAAALFLVPRIALLLRREPDIDELFTAWIARKDLGAMIRTLLLDSGPPLYYVLLHAVDFVSPMSVGLARLISIAAGLATLALVATYSRSAAAALLLAVYPQHVFFSAEARAYAICALLAGFAVVALDRWVASRQPKDVAAAAATLLLAAYTHYYGVLFFPLPIAVALLARDRRRILEGAAATAALALLYVPGFLLASRQPEEAISWMRIGDDFERVLIVAGSLLRIGFDARMAMGEPWQTAVFRILSFAVLLVALWQTRRSARALRFLLGALVPVGAALAVAAMGRTAYFPIRFESVLSVPVVLWITAATASLAPKWSRGVVATAVVIGSIASSLLVLRYVPPRNPERQIARLAARSAPPGIPIVASGLTYLELQAARRPIVPFPRDYELHPGRRPAPGAVARDLPSLRPPLLWAGDLRSPEAAAIRARFGGRLLARSEQIGLVAVDR
ncbi:MAG TPA: hypothetical protein VNL91_02410 [Thermoanaerobaculia bacterium]|nr:hypothetical protein [Thermoanaerobaculia bacterium]